MKRTPLPAANAAVHRREAVPEFLRVLAVALGERAHCQHRPRAEPARIRLGHLMQHRHRHFGVLVQPEQVLERRQALRDKFAHTYVIKDRAVPLGQGAIVYSTYTIFAVNFLFAEVRTIKDAAASRTAGAAR